MSTTSDLQEEIIEVLSKRDEAVYVDHLVIHTSADDRDEAKEALRGLIDDGMIGTSPGFKYSLSTRGREEAAEIA